MSELNINFNKTRYTIAKGLYPIFKQMLDLLKDKYKNKQLTKYDATHIMFKYSFYKVKQNNFNALILAVYASNPISAINFQITHLYDLGNHKLYYSLEPHAEQDLLNNRDVDFGSLTNLEFDQILQTAEKRTINYIKNRINQDESRPDLEHVNNAILNYQAQIRKALANYTARLYNHNQENYPREIAYLLNQVNSPLTLSSRYSTTEGLTYYELSCAGICVKVTYHSANMQLDNLKIEDYILHNTELKTQAKLNVPIVLNLCKNLYLLS